MEYEQEYGSLMESHGHSCPELALGLRMAVAVRYHLPNASSAAVRGLAESVGCLVDGIQSATGATVGSGRLVLENNGKLAATFWVPQGGHGLRLQAKPGGAAFPEQAIWDDVESLRAGQDLDDSAQDRMGKVVAAILDAEPQDLLVFEEVAAPQPEALRIGRFDNCMDCNEPTWYVRLFNHNGHKMCGPCHLASHGGHLPAVHPKDPVLD
ncbi:FmdE family protein [Actinocrispum sp. NPDC049592]|uniref:FmdE family protein n=1 Tax=Actinocrispum sp. NPDC049592 TaxID=3154835 RepID=UPI0034385707